MMMWCSRIRHGGPSKGRTRSLSMYVFFLQACTSHLQYNANEMMILQDLLRSDFHKRFMVRLTLEAVI